MSKEKEGSDDDTFLKQAISAFVSITHVIAFFQIVICSRHMAVAFDIPPKNIGIYFAKMYSLRSLLMSAGCSIEYGIYRIVQTFCPNMAKEVRKYFSMAWFCLLTICEISFLCVLYFSKRVAFHNYIVLNLEGMFFGFFQMSILSLIPEFVAYYMLSLYVSGTCIFIIQTIIDRCTKNSMLSVKIQSWICVLCSVISVGLWPARLFLLKDTESDKKNETGGCVNSTGHSSGSTQSPTVSSSSSGAESSAPGGGSGSPGPAPAAPAPPKGSMEYLISMSSITILKILTDKLGDACKSLNSEAVLNVQMLITRLHQITREQDISYDMLVAIDLVILSLKKCQCSESQLCLLAELSLFLRMKVLIKPFEKEQPTTVGQLSYVYGNLVVKDSKNNGTGRPVVVASARYKQLIKYVKGESITRAKRSIPERPRSSRTRRNASNGNSNSNNQNSKGFLYHLGQSLSPLMMFGTGSLVKDFLFPGVIPYGLLERDKCHLINLIVIIFLSVGPVTIFLINQFSKMLKEKVDPYHWFWSCMIPKILILIIALSAIHSKKGCTHKIRSSQGTVLFMTVVLLTCYGFLETMSFVGMGFYVKLIANDPSGTVDLQAIHNVSGKFFRYFVYKVSVGYNKTRIGSGFVLPNFRPPEPIPDTFCYWFKGAFSNGWKDIKSDFKMGIQQYLTTTDQTNGQKPILTSIYPDLLT